MSSSSNSDDTTAVQRRFVEHVQDDDGVVVVDHHPRVNSDSNPSTPGATPQSLTFSIPANPFSPPGSVASFDHTPMATPGTHIDGQYHQYPFPESKPRSGLTSVATSVADLPRMASSIYTNSSSRPTTGSGRLRESFQPPSARPLTIYNSLVPNMKTKRGRPKSTRLESPPHKPWIESRDPYARIAYFLTYGMMFIGVAISAVKCYLDYQHVPMLTGNLCKVLDEDFSSEDGVFGDNGTFFREVDMSGFGNGEFEMTTASPNNSFVANGHLYILPTLTSDSVPMGDILNGHVYNISGCTYNITQGQSYTDSLSNPTSHLNETAIGSNNFDANAYYKACSAVSNSSAGTIINPVQSARLSTRRSASMKFGRVEVVAKIPTGDWMWPAIWMLPVDSAYGAWPLSGEIDIMEARGNGPKYPKQGTDYVRGSLNWGPLTWLNEVWRTYGWWQMKRGSYDEGFHTYALEWTESFMRIYVDSRLHHMLDLKINEAFWDRGDFPSTVPNGSEIIALQNPWINGTKAAPFDQRFYLILDVGVGGTNGWFPDGPEKPWLDGSLTAMRDFLTAKDQWYPTWPEDPEKRAFVIDSVKMYQQC